MHTPIVLLCGPAGSGKNEAATQLRRMVDGPVVELAQADEMKRYVKELFGGAFTYDHLWGPSSSREIPVRAALSEELRAQKVLITERFLDRLCLPPRDSELRLSLAGWYQDCTSRLEGEGLTARHACQQLGTEVIRRHAPDTWVDHSVRSSVELLSGRASYSRLHGLLPGAGLSPAHLVLIPDGRFANEILKVRMAGGLAARLTGRRSGTVGNAGHRSETELDSIPPHFYTHLLDNSGSIADLRCRLYDVLRDLGNPLQINSTGIRCRRVA